MTEEDVSKIRATMIATRKALQKIDPLIHPLLIVAYAKSDGSMILDDLLFETDMSERTAAWACVTVAQTIMTNDDEDEDGDEVPGSEEG